MPVFCDLSNCIRLYITVVLLSRKDEAVEAILLDLACQPTDSETYVAHVWVGDETKIAELDL